MYIIAISILCDARYVRPTSARALAQGFPNDTTAWQCDERFEECVNTIQEVRRLAKPQGWLTIRRKGRSYDLCPVCAYALGLAGPVRIPHQPDRESEELNAEAIRRRPTCYLPDADE